LEDELRQMAAVAKSNEQRIGQLESQNEALQTTLAELETQQQDSHKRIRKLLAQLESVRTGLKASKSFLQ
jgi:chaperonin cofactor prefoldin